MSPPSPMPSAIHEPLQRALAQQLPNSDLELISVACCESTNQLCAQLARHGVVVVADQQTAGRGRRGRQWHSAEPGNIYCSIGMKKRLPGASLGLLSLAVGLSIARALQSRGVDDVRLKWPNDILLHDAKLGGILIENRVLSAEEFFLVIGFGLNLNLDPSVIDAIGQPAIALNHVVSDPVDREQLLPLLVAEIFQSVSHFQPAQSQNLIQQFSELDYYHGQAVRLMVGTDEIHGHYLGIAADGQLRVKTEAGEQCFAAAEISLRGTLNAVDR